MSNGNDVGNQEHKVVINPQGYYSISLAHKLNPVGWEDCGMQGSKEQCLNHIKTVWRDMRPLCVQEQLAAQ